MSPPGIMADPDHDVIDDAALADLLARPTPEPSEMTEIIADLLQMGEIPSFRTDCYHFGRTGEHFMEHAVPDFIQKFCTPNALTTLLEYLCDYASPGIRRLGEGVVYLERSKLPKRHQDAIRRWLDAIRSGTACNLYV